MVTVNGFTAEKMQEIADSAIEGAAVIGDDLVLTLHDGSIVNLGSVRGPAGTDGTDGADGDPGPPGTATDLSGYVEPLNDLGNVTGAVALDLSLHNIFRINPTGAVVISFTNGPAAGYVAPVTIIVANSTYGITWPGGTKFSGGVAPALSGETWLSAVVRSTHATVGASWLGVA